MDAIVRALDNAGLRAGDSLGATQGIVLTPEPSAVDAGDAAADGD
jgi:hypothetical protein